MNRSCNCSLTSKFHGKYIYEGKCGCKYLIYEVKRSQCDAIYIGNKHQTSRKIMENNFSNVQRLLKSRQKSDSFAAHFEQHFKYTTSLKYLCKCMMFKVVKHFNTIGAITSLTKPNFNLCY